MVIIVTACERAFDLLLEVVCVRAFACTYFQLQAGAIETRSAHALQCSEPRAVWCAASASEGE